MNAAARKRAETPAQQSPEFSSTIDRVSAAPEPANADAEATADEVAALGTFHAWLHRDPAQADSGVSFNHPGIPYRVGCRLARIESATQAVASVLSLIGADAQAASDHESVLSPYHVAGLQSAAEILVERIRDELHAISTQFPERAP